MSEFSSTSSAPTASGPSSQPYANSIPNPDPNPIIAERAAELVQKFQRDLNRILDSDRNTRRRGIQSLIDEIPWESSVKSLFQGSQPSLSAKQLMKSSSVSGSSKSDSKDAKSSKRDKDQLSTPATASKAASSSSTPAAESPDAVLSDKALAKSALRQFVKDNLLSTLLVIIRDPVEKCRELGLQLLMMSVKTSSTLPGAFVDAAVHAVAERIGQFPFVEASEEIRTLYVDLLLMIVKHKHFLHNHNNSSNSSNSNKSKKSSSSGGVDDVNKSKDKEVDTNKYIRFPDALIPVIITIVSKCLLDSCPNVKKSTCDVILEMCSLSSADYSLDGLEGSSSSSSSSSSNGASGFRYFVRLQFKDLLSGLLSNMFHQHSKVRGITISALGSVLSCLVDGYETACNETVNAALHKMKFDKIPTILLALANLCKQVITQSPTRLPFMCRTSTGSVLALASTSESATIESVEVEGLSSPTSSSSSNNNSNNNSNNSSSSSNSSSSNNSAAISATRIILCPADCSLVEILIILSGHENEDVKSAAFACIGDIATAWCLQNQDGLSDVSTANSVTSKKGDKKYIIDFFNAHASNIIPSLIKNTTEWTAELRLNYIRGLRSFLKMFNMSFHDYGSSDISSSTSSLSLSGAKNSGSGGSNQYFIGILSTLASAAKDFEADVRVEALAACEVVGAAFASSDDDDSGGSSDVDGTPSLGDCISLILPHIVGVESTNHKSGWTLLLAYILSGYGNRRTVTLMSTEGGVPKAQGPDRNWGFISKAVDILKITDIYETTSEALNESILLLMRNLINNFPVEVNSSEEVMLSMAFSLVFLLSKAKEGPVIPAAARIELFKLSILSGIVSSADGNVAIAMRDLKALASDAFSKDETVKRKVDVKIQAFLKKYYLMLMDMICGAKTSTNSSTNSSSSISNSSKPGIINWSSTSIEKSAFETLARLCPRSSWEHFARIFAIIEPQTRPPSFDVDKDSHEAHLKNYAAIDGSEEVSSILVNTRLSLIALLEGLISAGSLDWECGQHISNASESIMNQILLPNLVWRVGRVETMIRKVILATFYSLLKNGGVKPEALFASATSVVPPLISSLDDLDVSNRNLSALCLSIIFYRLKGAFAESAVHNIYSKLLLRLDDSSDNVRIAICDTLSHFLLCAVPSAYSGTTLDYTLDQLFIHLDDLNPSIQEAVIKVIYTCAEVDPVVVMKKAIYNKANLRDTVYCDKIVKHIEQNHR